MSEFLAWLSAWYNWPFDVTAMVAVGLALVSIAGFAKGASAEADSDGIDLAKPELAKPDAFDLAKPEFDLAKPEVSKAEIGKAEGSLLGWLGVGKVPLSVLLEVLLFTFGFTGLLLNALAKDLLGTAAAIVFPVTLIVAALTAMVACRAAAAVIARVAPGEHETALRSGVFIGQVGVTASSITTAIGQVTVERDDAPPALLNVCLADPEESEIPRGARVQLVEYDARRSVYRVRQCS